jgi:cyanate permease
VRDQERPPRYRFVVEGGVLLMQAGMGLNFIAVAPLFPLIIDDYGVDRATTSLLIALVSFVMAALMIPSAVLVARVGWRRSMAVGGALMSLMVLTPLAGSFATLLGLRIALAAGGALVMGSAPAALMNWFPRRELPLVNGVNVVAQSLALTVSVLTAAILADLIGWQSALMSFGMLPLAATLVWLLIARSPDLPRGTVPTARFSFGEFRAAAGDPTTLLLGTGMAGVVAAFIGLNAWLPTYYNEEFGFTLEEAGRIAALPSFFGIVGSIGGSLLSVRLGRRRPLIMASGALVPIAAVGTFASSNPLLLYPSVALFGVVTWLHFPSSITVPMELPSMTPERAAVAVATMLSLANLSGFFAPLLIGFARDRTDSFELGLSICAILPLSLLVAGYLLRETGPAASRVVAPAPVAD